MWDSAPICVGHCLKLPRLASTAVYFNVIGTKVNKSTPSSVHVLYIVHRSEGKKRRSIANTMMLMMPADDLF